MIEKKTRSGYSARGSSAKGRALYNMLRGGRQTKEQEMPGLTIIIGRAGERPEPKGR